MKKILLLILALVFGAIAVQAQKKSLIEVEGSSELKVIPDEALIRVNLMEKAMRTSEVTDALNKKTKAVSNALKESGVTDYEFTADNYYVNINRIYTKGTARDSGYVANQTLNIVVNDIEKDLVKIVETLHQSVDMSFQLLFRISESKRKGYEKQLLQLALKDAREKADIIATAMDIGDITVHKVNYTPVQIFQPIMYRSEAMMKTADDRSEPTFVPEEQKITDKVIVIYSFKAEGEL